MKLKLTNLFLVFCLIFFPEIIWADLDKTQTKQEKPSSSSNDVNKDKDKPQPETSQATTEPFFKDATYEKFEPREGSEPFSSSYLEGR